MIKKKLKLCAKLIGLSVICFIVCYCLMMLISFVGFSVRCENGREIPKIEIITEDGAKIESKEVYVSCTVSISDTEVQSLDAGIRGRGNSTWNYHPKKPYRIKFNQKVSLFGEEKNKSWVLLSMYNDLGVMKDALAFSLADSLGGEDFVPSHNYAELYINGRYVGLYLVTDQIDENEGRTNVENKALVASGEEEIPFLVELDAYAPSEGAEGKDFFYVGGKAYALKYPDYSERYSDKQFLYVKNYIQNVENACASGDLEALSSLVDIDSFTDYFLIQEIMGQPELNWKSVYMYKETGEKMKLGPLWDFDWALTGPAVDDYDGEISGLRSNGNWFSLMLENSSEFRALVSERLSEITPRLLDVIESFNETVEQIRPFAKRNHIKWHWYRLGNNPESQAYLDLEWCGRRILWLTDFLK